MASLEIEYDEDIYEGKLYGWRWFIAAHGLWQVLPPMFSARRGGSVSRMELFTTGNTEEYFEMVREHYAAIDLLDWNQSDVPPEIARGRKRGFVIPKGCSSGFHLFSDYRDAVNYAVVPYTAKRQGLSLPINTVVNPSQVMGEHLMEDGYSLRTTPLLAFVEASGAIVEHEKGYRAHLIRIVSLYSDGRKRARQELADNIGWPGVIHKYRKLWNMKNPSDTQLRRLDCD